LIPVDFITAWREHAPWIQDAQVEQDLIISRALVEIFQRRELQAGLAFRGGTALFKLHLPPARYSEDIDLVQIAANPIGTLLDGLRDALDPWLGEPKRAFKEGRVTLVYRVFSEGLPSVPLRLKVEINTREHFQVLGLERRALEVHSRWFRGQAAIPTYPLDELLGTKLRALYQRKKGRDLFDLWWAQLHERVNADRVIGCLQRYLEHGGHRVSRAEFEANLSRKLEDPDFVSDLGPLLASHVSWNIEKAAEYTFRELIGRLPGQPWKGSNTNI